MKHKDNTLYDKYFTEVDNTLGEYLWLCTMTKPDFSASNYNLMETLWNNQAHLDKFHEIRNKITELLTAIELENN